MKLLTKKQIEAIKAAINLNDLDEDYKNILIDLITDQGKTKEKEVSLYVDGAADLHSKTAGIGCSLLRKGQEIFTVSEPLIDKYLKSDTPVSSLITCISILKFEGIV